MPAAIPIADKVATDTDMDTDMDRGSPIPEPQPGGFLPSYSPRREPLSHRLPPAQLPKPRSPPLHAHSRNTAALKDHLDKTMMSASRAYHRRYQGEDGEEFEVESEEGQAILKEGLKKVLGLLEQVVDLVWISGLRESISIFWSVTNANLTTAAIQVPYLLRLTDDLNDYLSGYPPDLPAILPLLSKLDQAFSSLLMASVPTTPRPAMSQTDRVRLKSIAERVRLHAVLLAEKWEDTGTMEGDDDVEWEVEAAGVFGATLGHVGGRMGDWEKDELDGGMGGVGMSCPPDFASGLEGLS